VFAAEGGIRVGSLNCNIEGGVGMVFGSSKQVDCIFTRTDGKREYYSGNINNYGVDIGFTNDGFMVWAVFSPTSNVQQGGLSGQFVGAGAEASVAMGLGANALIIEGGENSALALQPLSIEGYTGLNLAGGIRTLELKHKGTNHRTHEE